MKWLPALLLLAALPAFAADDDVAKGLQSLTDVHRLAVVAELGQLSGVVPANRPRVDPWGTEYRFELDVKGYRIACAGSDRKFDESQWKTVEQFSGVEGDVVMVNGKLSRSNRNWLHARVPNGPGPARTALDELREAEALLLTARHPTVLNLMAAKMTVAGLQVLGKHVEANGELPEGAVDAWGTPPRVDRVDGKVRIVSAGADRKFDPESWSRAPKPNVDEDLVYQDGKIVRRPVAAEVLRLVTPLKLEALSQPPDPAIKPSAEWLAVGDGVTAPVVVARVEPAYTQTIRQLGIGGRVVVQAAIDENGVVEDMRLLKSVTPDLDMAALKALSQSKFRPGTKNGKPAPVLFDVTFDFRTD